MSTTHRDIWDFRFEPSAMLRLLYIHKHEGGPSTNDPPFLFSVQSFHPRYLFVDLSLQPLAGPQVHLLACLKVVLLSLAHV